MTSPAFAAAQYREVLLTASPMTVNSIRRQKIAESPVVNRASEQLPPELGNVWGNGGERTHTPGLSRACTHVVVWRLSGLDEIETGFGSGILW